MRRLNWLLTGSWTASWRLAACLQLDQSPKCGASACTPGLDAELLVDQACDLGAVGAALGLAHDVADDRADGLGVAVAHALGGVGVDLQGRSHDARQPIPPADLATARSLAG